MILDYVVLDTANLGLSEAFGSLKTYGYLARTLHKVLRSSLMEVLEPNWKKNSRGQQRAAGSASSIGGPL